MAVRRYEFYLRVVKTIFYERAQRVSKILFSPREDKIHIFKPPCNVLFIIYRSRKKFKTQVSKINFRSIMVKTWLYFNLFHILFKLKQYLYILLFFSCNISIFFDTNM